MSRKNTFVNIPLRSFLQAVSKAVSANMDDTTVLKVNGSPMKKAELLAEIAKLEAPYDLVDATHQTLANQVVARDASEGDVATFAAGYAAAIQGEYGADPAVFAKFAVPVRREARQLTPTQKVARTLKANATRALRFTKGAKEKETIKAKGDVTVSATLGGTTTSTPAPAPAPQPAPAPVATQSQPAPAPASSGGSNGVPTPAAMNGSGH